MVRQYPGERATVTNILMVTGAYTWFWGFEVTNPVPPQGVLHGVRLRGPETKLINLVVHDATDNGIFIGPEARSTAPSSTTTDAAALTGMRTATHRPVLVLTRLAARLRRPARPGAQRR